MGVSLGVRLSAHTAQALATGRYPLQSLTFYGNPTNAAQLSAVFVRLVTHRFGAIYFHRS
jgi:hypothetical protein